MSLTAREKMQIAVVSGSGYRTVDRCYAGVRVHNTTLIRITRAALQLRLPEPPPLSTLPDLGSSSLCVEAK